MAEEKKIKKAELKDEDLNNVSGGGWWDADNDYESDDTPRYEVGERVTYRVNHWSSQEYITGKITKVNSSKSGIRHREFTYEVLNDKDGKTETDVYESQIYYGNIGKR